MGIPVPDTIAHLQGECGLAQVGAFHQRGVRDNMGHAGICSGICLDWIRRVMNGKSVKYKYDEPASEGGRKRLHLQLRTHKLLNMAISDNYNRIKQLNQERKAAGQRLDSKKYWGAWQFWTKSVIDLQKQFTEKDINVDNELENFESKGFVAAAYDSFAAEWRRENPKLKSNKPRANQFDTFVVTQTPWINLDDADKFESFVGTHISSLEEGHCCMFAVTNVDGAGHAIAIHKDDTSYYLFDPEYGIYCGAFVDLIKALIYLFYTSYPSYGRVAKKAYALTATPRY